MKDPARGAAQSAFMLRYWAEQTDEAKKAHMANARRGIRRVSVLEHAVLTALNDLAVPYNLHKQIENYIVDFWVPSHQLIIECDGEYWHEEPSPERDMMLGMHGRVIHLTETDINTDARGAVLSALEEVS